jgi:hypothetical protein
MVNEEQSLGAGAAAVALQISQVGEISDARIHMQWQGVSTEQVARVLAQVGAKRRATLAPAAPAPAPDPNDPAQLQARLWAQIDELYSETIYRASRSPIVSDFCLQLLKQARAISLSHSEAESLVTAGQYLEQVRIKLNRVDGPPLSAEANQVTGILLWTLVAVVACLPLAAMPWLFPNGLASRPQIPQEYILLLGALGWGALGGAASTLHHLPWFVQLREYDPAYYVDYLARPIKGLMIGGIIFLLLYVGAGVFSDIILTDGSGLHSTFIFLGATAAGYKQEHIMELVDSVLRSALRRPA